MPPDVADRPVRVAACQIALRVGEQEANRAAAADAIAAAAARGARIVVLPELTPSGYVFADAAEARALGERPDGPTARQWAAVAAAGDIVIIGGFAELGGDGALYNSAMLVDRSGVRAVYRKAHLWDAEAGFFAAGDQPPPVVGTPFGQIAMMVCYDAEFPEWVRLAALGGADLLAVPANWPATAVPAGERPMVTVNIQVAAYTNRIFVAAACRCAGERGVSWVGGSVIAGPDGYPVAGPASAGGQPGAAAAELLIADCDLRLARSKAAGPRNDVFADRRPGLYVRASGPG